MHQKCACLSAAGLGSAVNKEIHSQQLSCTYFGATKAYDHHLSAGFSAATKAATHNLLEIWREESHAYLLSHMSTDSHRQSAL